MTNRYAKWTFFTIILVVSQQSEGISDPGLLVIQHIDTAKELSNNCYMLVTGNDNKMWLTVHFSELADGVAFKTKLHFFLNANVPQTNLLMFPIVNVYYIESLLMIFAAAYSNYYLACADIVIFIVYFTDTSP